MGGDTAAYAKKLAQAAEGVQVDIVSAASLIVSAPADGGAATGQTMGLGSYDMAIFSSGIGLNADGQKEENGSYRVSFGKPEAYLEEGADLSSNPYYAAAGTAAADYRDDAVFEYFLNIFASNTDTENSMKLPVLFDGNILKTAAYNYSAGETPEAGESSSRSLPNIAMLENYFIRQGYFDSEKSYDDLLPQAQSWWGGEENFKAGYVYENTYAIDSSNEKAFPAGKSFATPFSEASYKTKSSAFYPVYQEILRENTFRRREGKTGTDLLEEKISEADVIRYLLNFKNRRPANIKKEIRILDLEPDNHSEITTDGAPGGQASDAVLSWFQDIYTSGAIKITTMSTAEYIGKIEDITENYDVLYMGADTTDFNMDDKGESTVYNDSNMNGLIYYNIGDTANSTTAIRNKGKENETEQGTNNCAGLLLSDYKDWSADIKDAKDQTKPYRYSGNDLTKTKAKAIRTFADMGYPVIVSDRLVQGTENHEAPRNSFDSVIYFRNYGKKISDPVYAYLWGGKNQKNAEWPGEQMTFVTSKDGAAYWRYSYSGSVGYTGLVFTDTKAKTEDILPPAAGKIYIYKKGKLTAQSINSYNESHGMQLPETLSAEYDDSPVQVSTTTVDSASRIYDTLTGISAYTNVCSASQAATEERAQEIFEAANLSQPELLMTGTPKSYDEADKQNSALSKVTGADGKTSGYPIDFDIKIRNTTDATPDRSTYTVRLYVDSNSDGLYAEDGEDSEELEDLTVTDAAGEPADAFSLKGGLTEDAAPVYHVSRLLPSTMQGIVPWKLVVTQNSEDGAAAATAGHDSEIGYAYIHGDEPKQLRVLQINSDAYTSRDGLTQGFTEKNYNLEWEQQTDEGKYRAADGKKYNGIYGQLLADVADDFIVTVDTVYPKETSTRFRADSDKNTAPFNKWGGDYAFEDTDQNHETAARRKYADELDKYNMIIIGFSDSYQDLGHFAALAIKDFADSGKSVLFTHDTGSYNQTKDKDQWKKLNAYSNISHYYGYYFSELLRSTLFMDQYGIADRNPHTYKGTTYQFGGLPTYISEFNPYTWQPGFLAYGDDRSVLYEQRDSDKIAALEDAGYSIGWEPKSGTAAAGNRKTTPWVQGFSDYQLERIRDQSDYAKLKKTKAYLTNIETTAVSQANKGQITSYPYNVNTKAFGGSMTSAGADNKMTVSATHFQYYQLNMNADNIVVWYSLAGDDQKVVSKEYDVLPNDAVNQYYIFSAGNITYSGAGHAGTKKGKVYVTEEEAKLFVNTMVASFRATKVKPEGGFYATANAKEPISNLVLTGMDTTTAYTSEKSENQTVQDNDTHFASQDPTMQSIGAGNTRVYFRVKDANIGANKKTGAFLTFTGLKDGNKKIFYYSSADQNARPSGTYPLGDGTQEYTKGEETYSLEIHNAKDDSLVPQGTSLESGVMYYFTLPDKLQQYISDYNTRLANGSATDADIPTITMVPYTKFNDGNAPSYMEGEYRLTIQAAGLLPIG